MKIRSRLIALTLLLSSVALTFSCTGHPAKSTRAPVAIDVSDTGEIADLKLLARVWGYLKYFSPVVSERNIDWDKVLISQLQYLESHPQGGIQQAVRTMLDSAAPNAPTGKKTGARQLEDAKDIEKVNIDHSWIDKAPQLSASDKERLYALADYFKPFPNKYIEFGGASPKFKEETYGNNFLPEKHYRLLALFRYWNIIEYYLPAKYQQKGTWPATLAKFIPEFASANTERDYARALLKLNAAITDGHSMIPNYPRFSEFVLSGNIMRIPFAMGLTGDTVVVLHTDSGFSELSGIRKGDRIHTINGVQVTKYADTLKTMMSDPRDEMKDFSLSMSGLLSMLPVKGDSLTIGFERDGKRKTFSTPYGSREMELYKAANKKAMEAMMEAKKLQPAGPAMRMLDGDVLFIDPLKWRGSMADTTRTLLAKAKALVIECRTYPNFDFINFTHFLFRKQTDCILWNSTISYPGLTKTARYPRGPDHKIHFKGKVVALISERSISRPEMLTMIVKARGAETTLIGRTTGGADGDITLIPMVGNQGMRFVISGLGVLYPDGSYTQGIGIVPDIVVPNSIEQLTGEKDVILERALQYLATGK